MKPKKFNEVNVIYGEGQPEYLPLPAHKTEAGEVTTCWELSPEEKNKYRKQGLFGFLCLHLTSRYNPYY